MLNSYVDLYILSQINKKLMTRIVTRMVSPAQLRALDVVVDMIDRLTSNGDDNRPKFGRNIMDLVLGILNVDVNETVTEDLGLTATLDNHPSIDLGNGEPIKTIPINPDKGNDGIQINLPDWPPQTPPFSPHVPFPPQVWYNQEPEPIQTNKQEDVRYATEVSYTGDKNGIVYTTNTADVQYNGDFRDVQTSFNDK